MSLHALKLLFHESELKHIHQGAQVVQVNMTGDQTRYRGDSAQVLHHSLFNVFFYFGLKWLWW